MAVLRRKTAKNSQKREAISVFFRAPNHRRPRISAKDEMSVADNSLQKTATTASPATRAQSTSRRPRESGGLVFRPSRKIRSARAGQGSHQILSHRRRPVPITEMGPGLRREDENGRRGIESSEYTRALAPAQPADEPPEGCPNYGVNGRPASGKGCIVFCDTLNSERLRFGQAGS